LLEENNDIEMERELVRSMLACNQKGNIKNCISNLVEILELDPVLTGSIAYNSMSGQIFLRKYMGWNRTLGALSDTDVSNILFYMDEHYGIGNKNMLTDAISVVANRSEYHPVRELLVSLEWDGKERIKDCLHHFLGAEVKEFPEYPGEALRLFMMGAIHRVFSPGCKFELILCLVGGQGAGKSTFFRFLALRDEWFTDDLKDLDDKRVYEKLMGVWISEFSEMLATANAKSVEEIKSFISRQNDTYRIPYNRYSCVFPRQCVFGGTSNTSAFLPFDRTGNRRFVPVKVDMDKAETHILDNEAESRTYFEQLWAEAMVLYRGCGQNPKLTFDKRMAEFLKDYQQGFMPEDVMLGQIQGFLENTKATKVCSVMLYREALGNAHGDPSPWDTRKINDIMNSGQIKGWSYFRNPRSFGAYGRQRGWERQLTDDNAGQATLDGFLPVSENEPIPFGE